MLLGGKNWYGNIYYYSCQLYSVKSTAMSTTSVFLLCSAAANMFFICLFTIESLVKMYSVGFEVFFASLFNRFDALVIVFSWSEAALVYYDFINPVGVSVLRCARLLRVFKVTRSATV
jgi:Ion transport protein